MTSFDTRNNHRTYDADTHKVVPKDAVVLDLSDIDSVFFSPEYAPQWLREISNAAGKHYGEVATSEGREPQADSPNREFVRWIADQIEAQTKPPHEPEPGLWGVVEASVELHGAQRGRFLRDGAELSGHYWECIDWSGTYGWDYLIDPVLIRPGIEDES